VNTKIFFFLSFIPLFIIFSIHGYAESSWFVERNEAIVSFEEPLRGAAQEVADLYPKVKQELENLIQWDIDFRPTILLLKDKNFQKVGGNNFVMAFAVPRRNLIVIDYSKMKIISFTIHSTLKHELCHLLLHRYVTKGNLPKWLDEGIAQWTSDGMVEIVMNNKQESMLNKTILTGRYIPLRVLAHQFPDERHQLLLAYEESKSFVEYIVDRYGARGLLAILEQLKEGYGINEAIRNSLSISFAELEEDWLKHLDKRISWFHYLSRNLYNILFFVAALATILGFVKILIKKRRYNDEEDE